ncbi:MAG: hypothetical protein IJ014_04355 [Rikenellaceae bacterium]|nr:hypothetical protein [Rikenellaceae bacterium]
MKNLLKLMCVAAVAFMLSGCNLTQKVKLHGVTNISMPSSNSSALGSNLQSALSGLFSNGSASTILIGVDAENGLGLNIKLIDAQFTLCEGDKVYATATLKEPITLRRKTRTELQVPMNIELKGGVLATLSLARKVLQSSESLTVQGEVVAKCAGIKKKKTLAPQPLSEFIHNFAPTKQ